jgi:PLP dependent protein
LLASRWEAKSRNDLARGFVKGRNASLFHLCFLAVAIAEDVAAVRARIVQAAARAGRSPDEITLMAVTKMVPPERIREAYAAGLRVFGENRVQEFRGKAVSLKDLTGARWHLIGHLQSNKAALAAEWFDAVDSVDSLKLARKLNAAAENAGKQLPVLLEINIGNEPAKSGFISGSPDLEEMLTSAPQLAHLEVRGLMAIPPLTENHEGGRLFFRRLRELRDHIRGRKLAGVQMDMLSMGMSHDFEVAIEEGSTCVRIGTAIFGARPTP